MKNVIIKMMKITIILCGFLFFSGCSLLNDVFVDKHKYFEHSRNKEIGRKVTDIYAYVSNIYNVKENLINVGNGRAELRHLGRKCEYAHIVDTKSLKVVGWRYISNTNKMKCEEDFFFEGPF